MNLLIPRLLLKAALLFAATVLPCAGADFAKDIHPVLKEYCSGCHSTEKHKGDLDLERFTTQAEAAKHPKVWQGLVEQVSLGEMPPRDKPQPTAEQKNALMAWSRDLLDEIARTHAGDPGPVVLRRLSNAEYKYTIRDLTGVETLDPGREFPADSASGEGFMNVGNSLVMSPALLTKYLDAAKDVAAHAVLLPDGMVFSPSTSARDWTEERLAGIRALYGQFTENGGGAAVNLQGIKFDTKDGGVLPLEKYFSAVIAMRDGGKADPALNAKYFGQLWSVLNDPAPSPLLDLVRAQWRAAKPGDAAALAATVHQWQAALWRFTTVGHIGKRDGPTAWQVPVTPVAESREVRLKLPAPAAGSDVTLFLSTTDAGDGREHDAAVWENPRLTAPGRPDLPLRSIRAVVAALTTQRGQVFSSTAKSLALAAGVTGPLKKEDITPLAEKNGIAPAALSAWLGCLGIGTGEARIESYITQKTETAEKYDFIKGWAGADALSVVANSSDQAVRVPGNMKPHSVAVHPSPARRVVVGWRSPVAGKMKVEGIVQHAHTECGNGVAWALELRRGANRQRLAAGFAQDASEVKAGPLENIVVQPGDLFSLVVSPRDGNHSCDLTLVDLTFTDGASTWNLAKDVSPSILAGNPHADSLGHEGVWHFYSEPDAETGAAPVLPAGSLLARWQAAGTAGEKEALARELERLLLGGPASLAKDSPDAALHQLLTSLTGPLLGALLREVAAAPPDTAASESPWGLDPARFTADGLWVAAPSVVEVRVPADLAQGCEFVANTTLQKDAGAEGSVQMSASTTPPPAASGLTAGGVKEIGGKSTWSDGDRPVASDAPILVAKDSAARKRIEAGFDAFRQIFPAALCYTKIVPVDEVVTLTLNYREDDHLRRLMLDDAQTAQLERLWSELHYVSQDALKLVDGFEQLWQFATQDADPSAFTPMREPIRLRAEAFKKLLVDTQPAHLDAVLKFAESAYRRPLADGEKGELRSLYQRLRDEELPHDHAVRLTLARILVSPAFLYRTEQSPPGEKQAPVADWELATRLSYFLWSSAPDATLRAAAANGTLHQPDVLAAQARRLMADPRSRRLATEFACAWLHIYEFDQLGEKSDRHFPTFTALRGPMYEETIRFFTDLVQHDGSVLDILDADHTFLTEELAKHYGIPGVTGPEWRRVEGVKKFARGGILGQATTLAKQSGASRTSPILRGNWVGEVLLGEKLPRPPKDVPRLPEDEAAETLTVRQLTEKHSTDPKCFGCHRLIDPYGFSLEAFDAIGRLRDHDLGGRAIDTRTQVLDGTALDGLPALRDYLLTKRRDTFVRQFCRKLLGYSLGRGVQLSDAPLISEMAEQLKSRDYRLSALVEMIVRSRQFQDIRGKEMAGEE